MLPGSCCPEFSEGDDANYGQGSGVGINPIRVRLPSMMDPRRAGQREHIPWLGWLAAPKFPLLILDVRKGSSNGLMSMSNKDGMSKGLEVLEHDNKAKHARQQALGRLALMESTEIGFSDPGQKADRRLGKF